MSSAARARWITAGRALRSWTAAPRPGKTVGGGAMVVMRADFFCTAAAPPRPGHMIAGGRCNFAAGTGVDGPEKRGGPMARFAWIVPGPLPLGQRIGGGSGFFTALSASVAAAPQLNIATTSRRAIFEISSWCIWRVKVGYFQI